MSDRFDGPAFFAQLEPRPFSEILAEARRGLTALSQVRAKGVRPRVLSTLAVLEPALERIATGNEALLDPERVAGLRCAFEVRMRDVPNLPPPVRVHVERVTVALRAMELRVTAIARNYDAARLAAARDSMAADLWTEPARAFAADGSGSQWHELPPALHRAWLARLGREWETLNWYYLGRALKTPAFELSDAREKFGLWIPGRRVIAISGWHIAAHSWQEVVETLKHEMAHQIVHELWNRADAQPHGPEFRAACEKLRTRHGASADANRLERVEDSSDPTDKIVARIHKLLALGRSPNQHEAALAMERAGELLARFNLDATAFERERRYIRRWVGPTLTRRDEHHHTLAIILMEHFFVRVIWDHSYLPLEDATGVRMEIIGTRENVDIAEYVHEYLSQTLDVLWKEHKSSPYYAGGRKSQYCAGVLHGFLEKLAAQRVRISTETALVFKEDAQLEDHVAHLYPRLSKARAGGGARGEDFHAGVEQGRELSLRMGVTERSSNRGGLLPPGRSR